jgi:hypothetical protein
MQNDKHNPSPQAQRAPITLEAVMAEMQKEEERPVDKNGKPMTDSQIAYRERARRRHLGGPQTVFNFATGKREPLR